MLILRRLRFVLVLAVVFLSVSARAQKWTQIGTLPTSMYCGYFFDANHGVVAGLGAIIWVYNNGGWSQATVPAENPSSFTAIRLLRPGTLYAVSGAAHVWVSTDSGVSWQATSVPGSFALDVYLTKDSAVHITNAGTFARLDSSICLVTSDDGSAVLNSTNGGSSFSSLTLTNTGWSAYGDTCRKYYFIAGEDSLVHYSVDSGHTWRTCGGKLNADILYGEDGVLVRQCSQGVYLSPDYGTSWRQIGDSTKGSVGDDKNTIFAFGPRAYGIIAIHGGAIWRATSADTIKPPDPIIRTDTAENCPIQTIPVTIGPFTRPLQMQLHVAMIGPQSLSPTDTTVTFAIGQTKTIFYRVSSMTQTKPTEVDLSATTIEGCHNFSWLHIFHINTPASPLETQGLVIQNCNVPRYPLVIFPMPQQRRMRVHVSVDSGWSVHPSDTSVNYPAALIDTIWLNLAMPITPNSANLSIHTTDTVACTTYAWDTTVSIGVRPMPLAFTFDTVSISACNTKHIPILMNVGWCDTLQIEQLSITPANGPLTLETTAPYFPTRGNIDTIWLNYTPNGHTDTTNYRIMMSSHFIPEGYRLDTTLILHAMAKQYATPRLKAAPTLSLQECQSSRVPIVLTAMGCEDIALDSLVFTDAGAIVSAPITRDTLRSGRVDTIWTTLEPLYPGTRTQYVHAFVHRFGDQVEFDTTISILLAVSGANNEPLVATSQKLELSNCDTSRVPIVLHAPCDSLTITSAALTIDSKLHYITNRSFPLPISANQFDTLVIAFPPQGLNQSTTVSARVKGQFAGAFATFDTTVRSQVTFACATGGVEAQAGNGFDLRSIRTMGENLIFEVQSSGDYLASCDAEILSVLGTVIAKRSIVLTSNMTSFEWDLHSLASGDYFLRISDGEHHASRRFAIVR